MNCAHVEVSWQTRRFAPAPGMSLIDRVERIGGTSRSVFVWEHRETGSRIVTCTDEDC